MKLKGFSLAAYPDPNQGHMLGPQFGAIQHPPHRLTIHTDHRRAVVATVDGYVGSRLTLVGMIAQLDLVLGMIVIADSRHAAAGIGQDEQILAIAPFAEIGIAQMQGVVAGATMQPGGVILGRAVELVIAVAAVQIIRARTGDQGVISGIATDPVVALAPVRTSLPSPPKIVSLPASPCTVSSPPCPAR